MLALLGGAWLVTFVLAVAAGPYWIPPSSVACVGLARIGLAEAPGVERAIVEQIRLPRALLGTLVGAALAVSGAALQGLYRNALADPGIVGVTSGAGFATALAIVLGARWGAQHAAVLPLAAFSGALAAMTAVRLLAARDGRLDTAPLLLAGLAITALCGAGTGVLVYLSTDQQMRALQFWMMGSLNGARWSELVFAAPLMLLALLAVPREAAALDALMLGEREAGDLGIDVAALRRRLIGWVALGVGAAVALAGGIAFVGLAVPHLLRLAFGPAHRLLLPASALAGAALLLSADLVARTAAAPADLPIGLLTSLAGAPFLLLLLRTARSER